MTSSMRSSSVERMRVRSARTPAAATAIGEDLTPQSGAVMRPAGALCTQLEPAAELRELVGAAGELLRRGGDLLRRGAGLLGGGRHLLGRGRRLLGDRGHAGHVVLHGQRA